MLITDVILPHMPHIFVLGIVAFLTYSIWQKYLERGKLPLPPSLPGIPILRNLIEFVKDAKQASQHILLQKWAAEHGEIVRVKIGPLTEYYVNSDRAVKLTIQGNNSIAHPPLLPNDLGGLSANQRRIIHSCMTSVPKADAGLKFLHFESAKFLNEIVSAGPKGKSCISPGSLFDSILPGLNPYGRTARYKMNANRLGNERAQRYIL